jgi:hypothetical protein
MATVEAEDCAVARSLSLRGTVPLQERGFRSIPEYSWLMYPGAQ